MPLYSPKPSLKPLKRLIFVMQTGRRRKQGCYFEKVTRFVWLPAFCKVSIRWDLWHLISATSRTLKIHQKWAQMIAHVSRKPSSWGTFWLWAHQWGLLVTNPLICTNSQHTCSTFDTLEEGRVAHLLFFVTQHWWSLTDNDFRLGPWLIFHPLNSPLSRVLLTLLCEHSIKNWLLDEMFLRLTHHVFFFRVQVRVRLES